MSAPRQTYYQIMSCDELGNRDTYFQDQHERRQLHDSIDDAMFEIVYPWAYSAIEFDTIKKQDVATYVTFHNNGVIRIGWYEWETPTGETMSVPMRHDDAPRLVKEAAEQGSPIKSVVEYFTIEEVKRLILGDEK
jgi:hypothetical protein